MAYGLAHNGTRVDGMAPKLDRYSRMDDNPRNIKRVSNRWRRRNDRAEVMREVADCLSNGEATGAGTHWLACEPCLAFREYERWLDDARTLDKAGKSWGATRQPVNHCLEHDFQAWMDAQYDEADRWDTLEYEEWKWQKREYERDCDELDQAAWWATA